MLFKRQAENKIYSMFSFFLYKTVKCGFFCCFELATKAINCGQRGISYSSLQRCLPRKIKHLWTGISVRAHKQLSRLALLPPIIIPANPIFLHLSDQIPQSHDFFFNAKRNCKSIIGEETKAQRD